MRIIGNINSGHAFVIGYFRCFPTLDYQQVEFMVDSGCSITTLLSDDVARLQIDCATLQRAPDPVRTANGRVTPFVFPNPDLRLIVRYGWLNLKETSTKPPLPYIHCMPPENAEQNPTQEEHPYSVLGIDILHFFKHWHWRHDTSKIILQT